MRMNWVVSNAERFLRRSNQKHSYILLHSLIGPFLWRRQNQRRNLSRIWIPVWCVTSQNQLFKTPLAPLTAESCRVPMALPSSFPLTALLYAFLAWNSFPKASCYYYCYSMKCLAQLRQVPEQCEVWEHQTRLCLVPLFRYEGATSIICLTPTLQNYFLILLCSRRSHTHRLQVDTEKDSASLHSLNHTHTELNPRIFLFTFSVLSLFCHCHQELHVLKHLWAPGFIKDLFFGRISFIYLISPQKTLIGMLSAALFNSNRTLWG